MKIYIIMVLNSRGDHHVVEVFSSEKAALDYKKEIDKLYNHLVKEDDWMISYTERFVDLECLGLTGLKEHQEKVNDQEWCARFNTLGLGKRDE